MHAAAVGIDIGGTYTRAALVGSRGEILKHHVLATPAGGSADAIAGAAREALAAVNPPAQTPPIGLVLPGIWNRATGIMLRANNLPGLNGRDVSALAAGICGRPPEALDSDVVAAGWAQWRSMRSPSAVFAYLSVGTGVGGAIIRNGQVVRETHGGPPSLGSLIIDLCGPRVGHSRSSATLEELVCRDEVSPAQTADALSEGLSRIEASYGVELFVLGGGRVDRAPALVADVREAFQRKCTEARPTHARVERASLLSDEAGVIGAALLAL